MENRAHALMAGLFTLLLGIALLVAAQWFSRENYETVQYTLESQYSVAGLNLKAAVRLRGVEVGKVESIGFDPADPSKILIKVTIRGGTRITRGTTAQLGTQGITGLAYVILDDDGKDKALLPPTDNKRIIVQKSFIDSITGTGTDLIGQFGEVAQRVIKFLDDKNQTQLINTVAAIETAAQQAGLLAKSMEPAARAVPALVADARTTMAGAQTALRDVAPVLAEAKATLASIDKLAREYAQRADALERVAKSAEQMSGATQGAAAAVSDDVVPRITALLEELSRNSRNLDRLLSELNEQPSGLVFGRQPARPGPGEPGYTAVPRSK